MITEALILKSISIDDLFLNNKDKVKKY